MKKGFLHSIVAILLLMLFIPFAAGAEDLNSALLTAATNNKASSIKSLIAKGADVNARDNNNWTSLIIAADKGYESIVKLLLEKSANANLKDKNGFSALIHAVNNKHQPVIETLIANQAPILIYALMKDIPLSCML